jgi:hypothetical protein
LSTLYFNSLILPTNVLEICASLQKKKAGSLPSTRQLEIYIILLLTIIIININYCVVYLHTNIYLCRVNANVAQQSSPPGTPRDINSLFVYSNNIIRYVFLHISKNIPKYIPNCTPVKCNCSFSLFFFICSAYM